MLQGLQPSSWILSLALNFYLGFGWCSSACQQDLLPSPPWFNSAGSDTVELYPISTGTVSLHHGCPWPEHPSPEEATGLHSIPAESSDLLELSIIKTSTHGGPIASTVLQIPTLHLELSLPDTAPNPSTLWTRVWRLLCQMLFICPALPRGKQESHTHTHTPNHSLLALRKGPELCHLLYRADGCLWPSHKPLQWKKAQKRWVRMMCLQRSDKRIESDHSYGKGSWTWAGVLKRSLPI